MREIVSVQLGGYANYVGAHFWNLQDEGLASLGGGGELSPLPLFRAGAARRGAAPHAPRLQIVDASGAFGCLSLDAGRVVAGFGQGAGAAGAQAGQERLAARDAQKDFLWDGRTQRVERDGPPLSRYLEALEEEEGRGGGEGGDGGDAGDGETEDYGLDWNVRFWSDYCKVQFHERTCFRLPGVHDGVDSFLSYESGVEAASPAALDDAYDDLRFFIEECESLGGLSVCCDAFGGFAGFGQRYLSLLRDELGSSLPIVTFGATTPPAPRADVDTATLQRVLAQGGFNEAFLVSSLRDLGVHYVPLSAQATTRMPLVHPAVSSPFQTAAVLGTAMDLALTPLRQVQAPATMSALVRVLQPAPFACVSGVALSLPTVEKVKFERSAVLEVSGMTRVSCGHVNNERKRRRGNGSAPLRQTRLAAEVVIGRGVGRDFESACALEGKVAIPVPYPRFFDSRLDIRGRLRPAGVAGNVGPADAGLQEVGELGALAALYTDSVEGADVLHAHSGALSRVARLGTQGQGSTEMATLVEAAEALEGMATDYENDLSR